jgi:hypothetical protein
VFELFVANDTARRNTEAALRPDERPTRRSRKEAPVKARRAVVRTRSAAVLRRLADRVEPA